MTSDLAEVRGDRQESIIIRRGGSTLSAQNCRIALAAVGRMMENSEEVEVRGRVTVLMAYGADVQPDDRFNDSNGILYRVVLVRPNRGVATTVQAEVVQ
jgi:hypothetical protein